MQIVIKIRTHMPKRDRRPPSTTAVVVQSNPPHFPPPRIVMPIDPKPGHKPDHVAALLLGIGDIELDVPDDFFQLPDERTHPVILGAIRTAVAERKRRQSVA